VLHGLELAHCPFAAQTRSPSPSDLPPLLITVANVLQAGYHHGPRRLPLRRCVGQQTFAWTSPRSRTISRARFFSFANQLNHTLNHTSLSKQAACSLSTYISLRVSVAFVRANGGRGAQHSTPLQSDFWLRVVCRGAACLQPAFTLTTPTIKLSSTYRLPLQAPQGGVPDQGVPPQREQPGQHLPGHPEGPVEPRPDHLQGALMAVGGFVSSRFGLVLLQRIARIRVHPPPTTTTHPTNTLPPNLRCCSASARC